MNGPGMERTKELFLRIKELAIPGYRMFQDNRITVYSGYTTLYIVTAIIPFIILIISIVNLLPGYSAEDFANLLLQILPDLEPIRKLVEALVTELKNQTDGLLASAAAVSALWAASKGVMAIQNGLIQLDSGADKSRIDEGKSGAIVSTGIDYAVRVVKRLIFTVVLILLIPAMMVIEVLGDSFAGIIGSVLIILTAFLVILQVYARLPTIRRTLRSQIPGAAAAVVCWWVFTELFSFFISGSYRYSTLYGALAAVFLLLLWLRYMIMILFAGGILNRVLESELMMKEENILK